MEQKTIYSRLVFIHKLISSGMCFNAAQLAQKCGVSTRTIERDIQYMKSEWKAPIVTRGSNGGYVYKEKYFSLPLVMMSESEFISLSLLDKMIAHHKNTPFLESLLELKKKLMPLMPEQLTNIPGVFDHISFLQEPLSAILPDVWNAVLQAIAQHKVLEMTYKSVHSAEYNKPLIRRKFKPYHLFGNSGIYNNEPEICAVLEYSKHIAPLIEEKCWHSSQSFSTLKNGKSLITITTNQITPLVQWILSWGADMKVQKPSLLKKRILATLERAKAQY